MTTYISMLRGINVGGRRKIEMAGLKALYEDLGFEKTATYIQSGNVVFEAPSHSRAVLQPTIEQAIVDKYGFHAPVIIRESREMGRIIGHCPFAPMSDGAKVLIAFLSSAPAHTDVDLIQAYASETERCIVSGTNVYLYCPIGYGKSRLSNTFIERSLKVTSTVRNWRTVVRLHTLSRSERT